MNANMRITIKATDVSFKSMNKATEISRSKVS